MLASIHRILEVLGTGLEQEFSLLARTSRVTSNGKKGLDRNPHLIVRSIGSDPGAPGAGRESLRRLPFLLSAPRLHTSASAPHIRPS